MNGIIDVGGTAYNLYNNRKIAGDMENNHHNPGT